MSTLFDSSMSKQAQEEAKMLFNRQGKAAGMDEADVNQRLFQLFVQKEEMMRYSKDFKTMNTLLGHAEESDAFNWSQFNVQDSEDMRWDLFIFIFVLIYSFVYDFMLVDVVIISECFFF